MSAACSACGAPFRPQRSTARFCSPRCRVAAQRARDRGTSIRVAATRPSVAPAAVLSVTATLGMSEGQKPQSVTLKAQASQTRSAHRARSEVARHVPDQTGGRFAFRYGEFDALS